MSIENNKIVRTLTGKVVSNKMKDTITVAVQRYEKHPVVGKFIKRTTKIHAHDAGNTCRIGDRVTVKESKPFSKTKFWILVSIDEQAEKVS